MPRETLRCWGASGVPSASGGPVLLAGALAQPSIFGDPSCSENPHPQRCEAHPPPKSWAGSRSARSCGAVGPRACTSPRLKLFVASLVAEGGEMNPKWEGSRTSMAAKENRRPRNMVDPSPYLWLLNHSPHKNSSQIPDSAQPDLR